MDDIFELNSVSQLHNILGYEKPVHPLITMIESEKIRSADMKSFVNRKIRNCLYSVNLKSGSECGILYGRKSYDFDSGSLMFIAPNQVITPLENRNEAETGSAGWNILFHPELLKHSQLATKMHLYSFWHYDSCEALHLSEQEAVSVTNIARSIKEEYSKNIDDFSTELILTHLELLLNYSKRFYSRQFTTRAAENTEVVNKIENLLWNYFLSGEAEKKGLPTVAYCADNTGYSPKYLSDLLKKQTGKTCLEHIYFHLVEAAKNMLLGTNDPVNIIAGKLGFEYSQHFSKLFKAKTGQSPVRYRTG